MALARVKTWIAEILTAADLNGEFNNILNNALSMISPLTGALDFNGNEAILDEDADTSITADTDDQIDFKVGGTDHYRMTASGFSTLSSATITSAGALTVTAGNVTVTAGDVNMTAGAINTARATVASAATTADIWAANGNHIDWTGTTTTTAFPAAPQAGVERVLICAGAAVFTAGANMLIDGVDSGSNLTCAANDKVIVRAITTTQFMLSRVKYDGTAQAQGSSITLGTPVATTSGTSIDFTGIPTGVKRISITLAGVSVNGSAVPIFQIGDSGGVEATGYSSAGATINGTVTASANSTTGFSTNTIGPGNVLSGTVVLSLLDSSAFTWTAHGVLFAGSALVSLVNGSKSLSAELDRIRLTTNGSDTFDAGTMNIMYEF